MSQELELDVYDFQFLVTENALSVAKARHQRLEYDARNIRTELKTLEKELENSSDSIARLTALVTELKKRTRL
jgi:hypothetical protein